MRRGVHSVVGLLLPVLLATASPAFAGGQGWEVEVHGGTNLSSNPTKGAVQLPPAGAAITFPAPPATGIPSRNVPSWYFGDGALQLNQAAMGRFGTGIVPLDAVLQSRLVERRSGTIVGLRVSRSLNARFSLEFAFDEASGTLAFTPSSVSGVKASQLSFITTWNTLLGGPGGGNQSVNSDAALDDKRGRQFMTTGAVLINLSGSAGVKPYVALGAGLIAARNGAPSVELIGHYHFVFPSSPPAAPFVPVVTIDQTDTVTVRAVVDKTLTWMIGGGLKYALAEHWGVRADVRDHLNADTLRTTVAAAPASASTGPPTTLVLIFNQSAPSLQFTTSTGSTSTLGGSPVVGFKTFNGTGIVNQVNITAGIFWRF